MTIIVFVEIKKIKLTVTAEDPGGLRDTCQVFLAVKNVNDNKARDLYIVKILMYI